MVNGRTVVSSMTIAELKPGQSALVSRVGGEGALRQHFLDMGIIPGAVVTLVKYAPMGDPMELQIHGYELTIRLADAEKIEMCRIVSESGADYIKTSTGFAGGGATFADVKLFAEHVRGIKIKAAGGIKSVGDAEEFMALGADRLGTSSLIKYLKEGK